MTNLLFILLFPSISNSVLYPVAAIPLVLAVINWILIMARRKSEGVAGVICAGSKFVKYLFFAYLAVIIVQIVGMYVPGHWIPTLFDKEGDNTGIYILLAYAAYTFICYYFTSFRLADAREVAEAKEEGGLVIKFAKNVAGAAVGTVGAAGGTIGLILGLLQSMLYPIVVVGGQTFVFMGVGAASFCAMLAIFIPIVAILATVGAMLILILMFFTGFIVTIATILRFLANLRYLKR